MSLFTDLFGGNDANDTVKAALAQINQIKVPNADQMKVQLQKLVQMGVLTPDQAQTYLSGPNAYDAIKTNPLGTTAQVDAINKLKSIAAQNGMDPQEVADLNNVLQQLNTQERGQRGAILQGQAERGALTGGETMAAQLEANQNDTVNANANAINANSAAATRALNALTTSGTMGNQLEAQQFGEGSAKATAANAIEAFNAQQKSATDQFNTSTRNAAKSANLSETQRVSDTNAGLENEQNLRNADLIQKQYEDELEKARAAAGESNDLATLQESQAEKGASFVGNLIGTAGQAGGNALSAYLKGGGGAAAVPAASDGGWVVMDDGGKVPGKAVVPGDSPKNDRVPALLSPGEIVVPRTAARTPDRTLDFLNRLRRSKPPVAPHPKDVATVLQALSHVRTGV